MAETTGLVQKLTWSAGVQVLIGPTPSDFKARDVVFPATDSPQALAVKHNMVDVLAVAQRAGLAVTVTHPASGFIDTVHMQAWNITPHGPAVRGDLFSVAGTDFPADARLAFQKGGRTVEIEPVVARPHLVVIDELPAEVPTGANMVQVVSEGYASDQAPVVVIDGPSPKVRVIHAGPPSDRPYTIALVANPAILGFDGVLQPDTMATDPILFRDMVTMCLRQLFTLEEGLLRYEDFDRRMRIVAVRDPASDVSRQTALVEILAGPGPRLDQIMSYLSGFGVRADIGIALSSANGGASAILTLDDDTSPGEPYVLDAFHSFHYELAAAPGVIAIPHSTLGQDDATVLHEFGHACSPLGFGQCLDLYIDGSKEFDDFYPINKHFRANADDPIPADFSKMDDVTWLSDLNFDYPADWISYHPKRRSGRPNIMRIDGKNNLFDWITFAFLAARLRAKTHR
jgi:hypothetical protein